jgi:hypothetical protein
MRYKLVITPRIEKPIVVPVASPIIPKPTYTKNIEITAANVNDRARFIVFIARTSTASTIERNKTYAKYGPRDKIIIFMIGTTP